MTGWPVCSPHLCNVAAVVKEELTDTDEADMDSVWAPILVDPYSILPLEEGEVADSEEAPTAAAGVEGTPLAATDSATEAWPEGSFGPVDSGCPTPLPYSAEASLQSAGLGAGAAAARKEAPAPVASPAPLAARRAHEDPELAMLRICVSYSDADGAEANTGEGVVDILDEQEGSESGVAEEGIVVSMDTDEGDREQLPWVIDCEGGGGTVSDGQFLESNKGRDGNHVGMPEARVNTEAGQRQIDDRTIVEEQARTAADAGLPLTVETVGGVDTGVEATFEVDDVAVEASKGLQWIVESKDEGDVDSNQGEGVALADEALVLEPEESQDEAAEEEEEVEAEEGDLEVLPGVLGAVDDASQRTARDAVLEAVELETDEEDSEALPCFFDCRGQRTAGVAHASEEGEASSEATPRAGEPMEDRGGREVRTGSPEPLTHALAQLRPTPSFEAAAHEALAALGRVAQQAFGPEAQVRPFGSLLQGAHLLGSDLDVCIEVPGLNLQGTDASHGGDDKGLGNAKQVMALRRLMLALPCGFAVKETRFFERIRVPILVLEYRGSGSQTVEADISMGCRDEKTGVEKGFTDRLIRRVLERVPRALPLVLLVKQWAKAQGLNKSFQGFLNSLGWTLLCLFFPGRSGGGLARDVQRG